MAQVIVSAARLSSMLDNSHRTVDDLYAAVPALAPQMANGLLELRVTLTDLEAAARFFKRPWSYLLIDEPEAPLGVGRDHRRRPGLVAELSEHLLDALRASEEQLEHIIDLFPDDFLQRDELELVLPAPDEIPQQAETAGTSLRAWLAVSTADQLGARDEFEALRLWIEAASSRGVYVAQRKLEDSNVRAFSLLRDEHALAVLDTSESGWARLFSLLHELVHLVMRSAGLCDMDESTIIERWCNAVAATALMPTDVLAAVDIDALHEDDAQRADESLRELAAQVGVSQQALLIRCHQLGELRDDEYEALEDRRRTRRATARAHRGGDFYLNAVNLVGRRYTRRVLSALDDAVISASEASSALGVREHRLSGLRKWL